MPTEYITMHDRSGLFTLLSPRRLLAIIAAMSILAPAVAAPSLTPHSATYKIKISVLSGQLDTRLESIGDDFVATHTVKPTGMSRMFSRGLIRESSQFHAMVDGIRTSAYSSLDTLSRDKGKVEIQFDWDTGETSGTVNGEEVQSVIDGLAYDRVAIQYQLMHDLLSGTGNTDYTMFETDRLRPVSVRNIGHKTISVPAGEYEAVGVEHRSKGSQRSTTMWCVEELGYLPVMIEQHRNGKLRFRASLLRYRPADRLTSTQ